MYVGLKALLATTQTFFCFAKKLRQQEAISIFSAAKIASSVIKLQRCTREYLAANNFLLVDNIPCSLTAIGAIPSRAILFRERD